VIFQVDFPQIDRKTIPSLLVLAGSVLTRATANMFEVPKIVLKGRSVVLLILHDPCGE